jgi:acetyl esterase/lipase
MISLALVFSSSRIIAADTDLVKATYTYKTIGETEIKADVYRSSSLNVEPVVVWIHGGALLMGGRGDVPRDLSDLCRSEGFALVSIDYRLMPQVRVPAIVEDVRDALRWISTSGSKLFFADPNRIVVAGASAGGYLTLMTGFDIDPRPKALVSYWGFGDLTGDWTTQPNSAYRSPFQFAGKTPDEARETMGREVLTNTDGGAGKARGQYFSYLKRKGLWSHEATGMDPKMDEAKLKPYCPLRNVSKEYPPTMLIHGSADTDVACSESEAMASELARHKVSHELIVIEGGGHGLGGGDRKLIQDAHQRALSFIRDHLK